MPSYLWSPADSGYKNLATGDIVIPGSPTRVMQVGAAMGFNRPGRGGPYYDQYDVDCGPISITREYQNGSLSSSIEAQSAGFSYSVTKGWDVIYSVKPFGESTSVYQEIANGTYDTQIQNYLSTWPSGTGGYFLIGNEPDQNKKGISSSVFKSAVEHLNGVLTMPTDVKLGIALMTYSWKPGNPVTGGDGSIWLPDIEAPFHLEIHGYGRDSYPSPSSLFGPVVADLPNGWTWGVGETNAYENESNHDLKANWFLNTSSWCYLNGASYFCFFDVKEGDQGAEFNVVRSSSEATAAAKLIAETYH